MKKAEEGSEIRVKRAKREDYPLVVSAFCVEDILEANRKHDSFYGWSYVFPNLYMNQFRFPESVTCPPFAAALP